VQLLADGEDRAQQLRHEIDALREAQGTGDQKLRQQIGDLTRTLEESRQATAHKETSIKALHGDVASQVRTSSIAPLHCLALHAAWLMYIRQRARWRWGAGLSLAPHQLPQGSSIH
jgi:hypothetical protein